MNKDAFTSLDSDRRSGDRDHPGNRPSWALILQCKIYGKHDWQPLPGHGRINFRSCRRCGETGWEM